jgi:hypothetical protein
MIPLRYRGLLLLRRALQDRDHSFDNIMDCGSGWKADFLATVFLPISFAMALIAGDQKIPIGLLDASDRRTVRKGTPSLHTSIDFFVCEAAPFIFCHVRGVLGESGY